MQDPPLSRVFAVCGSGSRLPPERARTARAANSVLPDLPIRQVGAATSRGNGRFYALRRLIRPPYLVRRLVTAANRSSLPRITTPTPGIILCPHIELLASRPLSWPNRRI